MKLQESWMTRIFVGITLLLLSVNLGFAADNKNSHADNKNPMISRAAYMALDEIKPGMKGTGRTIFQGSKTEDFTVEILGVLPGLTSSPKRSVIIMRLISPQTDRTGVFAGMSGSPVFIDGKLIGAIAFSFPFSKEPLGAITPIEDMLSIFNANKDSAPEVNSNGVSFKEFAQATQSKDFNFNQIGQVSSVATPNLQPMLIGPQAASVPGLSGLVGQTMMPIATPVAFSGIDPQVIQYFSSQFQALGFQPVAGISGASPIAPLSPFDKDTLTPGKKITVDLVRGDFALSASGTVTWRDGETIYAFGHPFFAPGGAGKSEWPMTEGDVITVVPHVLNSFNIATSGKTVGTIQQDRNTGIYGKLGVEAKMIPLSVSVTTSRGKKETYKMEVVSDGTLTPLLVQISTLGSIIATERTLGDLTLQVQGEIKLKGQNPINFSNSFSSAGSFLSAVIYSSFPISSIYTSGFDFQVEGINLNFQASDRRANGTLLKINVDRTEVNRGDTINVQAFARNERGEIYVEKIPVKIPEDAPTGKLSLTVGDGNAMTALERRNLIDSNPTDLSALVRAMNNLPRNDRLYVKLYYADSGAIINNRELPSLPPSMMATLDSSRTTGSYLSLPIATVLDQALPPAQFLIGGQQTITVKVVK